MSKNRSQPIARRNFFFALLIAVSMILALLATLLPLLSDSASAPRLGEVAGRDYLAPKTITYDSKILTEQKREVAVNAVLPVYTAPDTSVARQQLESLRATLAYITCVRADTYASAEQKMDDLAVLDKVTLSQETAITLLGLTDSRWQMIQQETIDVLEEVMSRSIRPTGLAEALERVPLLVSLTLPETQAAAVANLTSAFIAANSQYSESLTQTAQRNAREAVIPTQRTLVAGQAVILQGQVFGPADLEALENLGMIEPEQQWTDLASAAVLVTLLTVFLLFYFRREKVNLSRDARSMTLVALIFLVFDFGARLTIPGHTIIPYAFPLAAYSLTIAVLFGAEPALISSLPLAVLVAYGLPNALELTIYYVMGSMFGVLTIRRARRMSSFVWAGAAIAVSESIIILVYRLPKPTTDAVGLITLVGAAFFNALASASVTVLLQFALAQFLGMTTPMQLVDLTRPDHPLLKLLLRDAPGTYQHSLQVANLAEQAAERVGADPLLTRVGALYHDVGKSLNPMFFIENQLPGYVNPHDIINAEESAEIILHHVADGLELGIKHRLPRLILHFIAEHHGTLIARYQYFKAVKAAGGDENKINIEQFRYPGPRPQSRETAILMLADGSEARVRAERPTSEADLRQLIKEVISDRVANGQLDDTKLTLHDLEMILESFTATLKGIYHPRIKYPKMEILPASDVSVIAPQLPADTPKEPISAADLSISPERYR